jgi:hypothetical protein
MLQLYAVLPAMFSLQLVEAVRGWHEPRALSGYGPMLAFVP